MVKPLAADDLIGLAAGLAKAVAGMHGRGVLHRDICPANIVLSCDGAPCLVGFGLARSLAEIRPEFTHHSQIVGTLAYLAPEQTGRTGRPVDQRADLYALGATLYELATGEPPFGAGDPLRLTHDHLARVPTPPGPGYRRGHAGPAHRVNVRHPRRAGPNPRTQRRPGDPGGGLCPATTRRIVGKPIPDGYEAAQNLPRIGRRRCRCLAGGGINSESAKAGIDSESR